MLSSSAVHRLRKSWGLGPEGTPEQPGRSLSMPRIVPLKEIWRRSCPAIFLFLMIAIAAVAATLKSATTIPIPGPAGKRFDYLTIDYDDHYLLSAHLAAGLLYVIDLRTNKVLKAIH